MFSREGTIDVSSLDTLLATFRKKWLADPTAHQEAVGCDGGIVLSGAINNSIPGPNFLAMTAAAARLEPAVVTQIAEVTQMIGDAFALKQQGRLHLETY